MRFGTMGIERLECIIAVSSEKKKSVSGTLYRIFDLHQYTHFSTPVKQKSISAIFKLTLFFFFFTISPVCYGGVMWELWERSLWPFEPWPWHTAPGWSLLCTIPNSISSVTSHWWCHISLGAGMDINQYSFIQIIQPCYIPLTKVT